MKRDHGSEAMKLLFYDLNIFPQNEEKSRDNIWLFNGATYFMKNPQTHKISSVTRAYHKNVIFYWISIINKAQFLWWWLLSKKISAINRTIEMSNCSTSENFPSTPWKRVTRKKKKGHKCLVQSFIELAISTEIYFRTCPKAPIFSGRKQIILGSGIRGPVHTSTLKEHLCCPIYLCDL